MTSGTTKGDGRDRKEARKAAAGGKGGNKLPKERPTI